MPFVTEDERSRTQIYICDCPQVNGRIYKIVSKDDYNALMCRKCFNVVYMAGKTVPVTRWDIAPGYRAR